VLLDDDATRRSRIAGSQVELIDDCGHVLQADQPERARAAISTFLTQAGG
jgi:pimeloyl-ACP methyl ester carboxylesterase